MQNITKKAKLIREREYWLKQLEFWYLFIKEKNGKIPVESLRVMKETMMICGEMSKNYKNELKIT